DDERCHADSTRDGDDLLRDLREADLVAEPGAGQRGLGVLFFLLLVVRFFCHLHLRFCRSASGPSDTLAAWLFCSARMYMMMAQRSAGGLRDAYTFLARDAV